ncbi:MAG TPA: hypothetical protein VLV88_06780 [Terriglobales bacterium]|nr:hypothetical protein [Terriglobales bacterium]
MWFLLFSPILALFPRRWRGALHFSRPFPWVPATIASGLLESLLALAALLYWYSYSVETWADRALDAALRGNKAATSVPGQVLGFAALTLWALHPLTWVSAYLAIEGTVRALIAYSAGDIRGTLPLYLVDWGIGKISGRVPTPDAIPRQGLATVLSSIVQTLHEHIRLAMSQPLADEIQSRMVEGEEITEILSQRAKSDWIPPRVVRIGDIYYRLEKTDRRKFPRPYSYTLRRLPAGVPGRSVLVYAPDEPERLENK